MFEKIFKMFYPSRCIFCDKLLEYDSLLQVCDECYRVLPFLEGEDYGTQFCDKVYGVFNYDDRIKEVIQQFKYHNKAYLYKTFARLMMMHVGAKMQGDIIVSVPLYKDRERLRGYNQAHLIAKELSCISGIKYDRYALSRRKNTGSLALCDSEERVDKIKGAFFVDDSNRISGRSVIIVDDVFTTGSTINECSKVLKESGAISVIAVVIAKTKLWLQRNDVCVDTKKG